MSDAPRLELQIVTWLLGTEPESSVGAVNAPATPPPSELFPLKKEIDWFCMFSCSMCILTPFEECCTLQNILNMFF